MLDGCTDWPEDFIRRYREQGYWQGVPLGQLLREQAQRTPQQEALVDGNRRWSYAELDQQADRLAAGLAERGLVAGQRVLVQLPNIAEFFALTFALLPSLYADARQRSDGLYQARIPQVVFATGTKRTVQRLAATTHVGLGNASSWVVRLHDSRSMRTVIYAPHGRLRKVVD